MTPTNADRSERRLREPDLTAYYAVLYGIEKEIRGRSPDERREVRNQRARPLLKSLRQWFETTLLKLSRKSDTTAAIRYALELWEALTRYCDDGRLEIDNNAANTASGIGCVMPHAGLCRVRADWVRPTACSSLAMRHK
jgi:Transposase IS66 family